MKILKFHTGRGGRFNNSGFVTFVEFEKIKEGNTFSGVYLNDTLTKCFCQSGNELDFEINEDGTGYLNEDHDYDTTTCVLVDELDEKQINALIRAKDSHWNANEIERILNSHYSEFLN